MTYGQKSDFISLHAPLLDATRHIINAQSLAKMKRGVYLINDARGGLIDDQALVQALDSGQVAGAALDVFEQEPPRADNPLVGRPDVIVTPHLGRKHHRSTTGCGTRSGGSRNGHTERPNGQKCSQRTHDCA